MSSLGAPRLRSARLVWPGLYARLSRSWRGLFAIGAREASFERRGFLLSEPEVRRRLEQIGETFLGGYRAALISEDAAALRRLVDETTQERRGFAVEGAAMGAAVADAVMLGGNRLDAWMQETEARYTYLAHVGVGWALARIPWRRAALMAGRDPVHHWLMYDGLGFHDAYFGSRRILSGHQRPLPGYAARAYDQGVGRAFWFVAGGDGYHAVELISRLAPSRQPDLWSGLGLALAYAGGASAATLESVAAAAGGVRDHLAQGVAFGAEAHARAEFVPAHTEAAAKALTGLSVDEITSVVRRARATLCPVGGGDPSYEAWRGSVRNALARSGGLP